MDILAIRVIPVLKMGWNKSTPGTLTSVGLWGGV